MGNFSSSAKIFGLSEEISNYHFFTDFIFSFSLTPSGSSGSSGKVFGQIVIKKEKLFKYKIFRVYETDLVTIEACEDTPAMAMDLSIGGERSKYLKAKKA